MILSHTKNFIFFRTKKTAGTSIEVYFQRYCLPAETNHNDVETDKYRETIHADGIVGSRSDAFKKYYDHMTAIQVRTAIGANMFDRYFKFASTRNPWEKLVSRFWWETKYKPDLETPWPVIQNKFLQFCKRPRWYTDDRTAYMISNKDVMDDWVRYEHLHEDLQRICTRLDIPWESERFGNFKSETRMFNHIPYTEYYTPQIRNLVDRHMAFEQNHFGYTFGDV